ncbi:MAG: hypothetical protein EX269_08990 [Acidimicrobiales bacterium]|nr:MAG: hypothetical protein EX269_08990 [Acidimicrobiales bacterium]
MRSESLLSSTEIVITCPVTSVPEIAVTSGAVSCDDSSWETAFANAPSGATITRFADSFDMGAVYGPKYGG